MRRLLSAFVVAIASLVHAPAHAGGLLQDLFAPAPRAAPAAMYYAPQQPQVRFLFDEGLRVSRRPVARRAIARKHHVKQWAAAHKRASASAGARAFRHRADGGRRMARMHGPTAKKKLVAVNAAPVAPPAASDKALDPAHIDNDPTLRIGDAYMTPDGLRIYRGPEARAKERKVFVDFRRSTLGAAVKSQLAALEGATRSQQFQRIGPPAIKAIPAGASSRRSVNREGRIIRVVGP